MADENNVVPQDDLPDNLVPESDLPDSYDPRSHVPRAIGAGAGAVAGAVGVPFIETGVKKAKKARLAPVSEISVPKPTDIAPGVSAVDEAVGKGVSNAFTQHTREAQVSQRQQSVNQVLEELKAKGVPVNPKLLAEMPTQYAMPSSGILINADTAKKMEMEEAARRAAAKALPENATIAERVGAKLWPGAASDVGHFLQGVSEHKLPFGIQAGPLLGHLIGGAATGSQAIDAYNRGQEGDTTGSVISGVGALGTGVSTIPMVPPPIRAVGAGVGLSAEAINAYRDAMRRGQIEHGRPENYENTTPMGDSYACGGLVHLADGGMPDVNMSAQSMPNMTGQPGVGYMQMPQSAMLRMQLEKELANRARLRAGATGMGMAIPGQQGVKMMPGNIEAGLNIPVSQGNVDISGYRSINPVNMPAQRGGHMQGANVRYTLPFAEGGDVKKPDANEGQAFIGYPQINKNRKIGSGTGFLDALVGAPPSRENILNPSDYSYMEGYEKGEPYGIAGMVLPFAGAAAKPLAREVATRAFMGESLTPRMMRGLMPEQPVAGIFRNQKGGNWAPETMTQGWTPEQQLAETLGFYKNDPALENWVNTQLTRYVKNDMGTPGDPIRALADQGILHYKPRKAYLEHNNQPSNLQREAEVKRGYANAPEGESALTQLGKDWETNVDAGVTTRTITPKFIEWNQQEFPWLKNAEGKKLHSIDDEFLYSHLGFDHIVDVLREQLAAGQLRPESLKNLSVPQAVQRVHDYNLAKEKAMQKIKLQADAEMPVHKEYPEGYRWLELKHPSDNNLTEAALKYEGNAMGHCVGGYCPDVLEGRTKIYSLRDAKGEPHVTIEATPRLHNWGEIPQQVKDEATRAVPKNIDPASEQAEDIRQAYLSNWMRDNPKMSIEQIKGKQNLAPKEEYLPFVQDFVRSGNWADVKDMHNVGLKDMAKTGSNYELANVPDDISKLSHTERYHAVQEAIANNDIPKYATEEEVANAIRKYANFGGLNSLE